MEYLMTYGWAIIIVVIVGVALWRLGVFTPSTGIAHNFDEFEVTDHTITGAGVATVVFKNVDNQNREVTVNTMTADAKACTGMNGMLSAGSSATATCSGLSGGAVGTLYTGIEVQILYTLADTDYTETGTLSGEYK